MKYFIQTYGCQYNEWDAARINYMLQKIGLTETDEMRADIIFVVACSVRQTAVDRLLGKMRHWQNKKIIITGCILKQDKTKLLQRNAFLWDGKDPTSLNKILPDIDISQIPNLLKQGATSSVYLPIMIGCNNFCTYCAVPYTRGRETSLPFDDIINNFKTLVKKDEKLVSTKERTIMLLGQNVNSYQFGFAKLLKTLNDIPGDFIITFTSNHPKDMTDEVIDTIAACDKVKKQIHLPLQSGSDKILKAMNRPYSRKQYLDLVKKIKAKIPNIEISTDIIVGFPDETEDDFQKTVDIFKTVKYSQAYINKYSPRAGTVAYKLGDAIPWSEKQRRWRILNDIIRNK